jgi:hypothetical protein
MVTNKNKIFPKGKRRLAELRSEQLSLSPFDGWLKEK